MQFAKIVRFLFVKVVVVFSFATIIPAAIPTQAQPSVCEKPVDVVLLLDKSGSVSVQQSNIIAFATQLVGRFQVAADKARFGVVRYAEQSAILLQLSEDAGAITGAIALDPALGVLTNIEAGLTDAAAVMGGARAGIPRVIVHLTDGLYNMGSDPVGAAQQINSSGIHLFGVDYGNSPNAVIRISNMVFPTGGLGVDQLTGIISALAGAICGATVDVTPLGTVPRGNDNRINPTKGDLAVVLYVGADANGEPAIEFYCVDQNSVGTFTAEVTVADLQGIPHPPAQNTEVKRVTTCSVEAVFYVLTSGEYQVNIGPFSDGKVYEVIFSGLTASNVHYGEFNLFNP